MGPTQEPTGIRDWFDSLSESEAEAWLDAWEDDAYVPSELLDTLPRDRRLAEPGQAVAVASRSWWIEGSGGPAPNYRMVDFLHEFLREEHRRRRS